jgi:nucleotide sugar dehydrogenase
MTLKLTLGGVFMERDRGRSADEASDAHDDIDLATADETLLGDPFAETSVAGLALAMGTVAERTAAERSGAADAGEDFAAAQLAVEELARVMGTFAALQAPDDAASARPDAVGLETDVEPGHAEDDLGVELLVPPADVERAWGGELSAEGLSTIWLSADTALLEAAAAAGVSASGAVAAELASEELAGEVLAGEVLAGEESVREAFVREELVGEVAVVEDIDDALLERAAKADLQEAVVAVLGLEGGGLSAAIALRSAGARVIGLDRSKSRLERIRSGAAELAPSEREALRGHLDGSDFVLTENIETLGAAEFVLICAPMAVDRERRPNVEMLRRACEVAVAHARPGQTLVLTTTAWPGSTHELLVEPLEERGLVAGEDVFVAFSPERGDGPAPNGGRLTSRILGGVSERCYEKAAKLMGHLCDRLCRVSSPATAEMAKLYESTFRAVNIALAFEMADACRAQGLNTLEVTAAAATKRDRFMAHRPSAGVGGHSVALDPQFVAQALRGGGRPATITEEALRKIAARPRQIVWRAQELLIRSGRQPNDARVLVVGAGYKPGAADWRQSPAVEIISMLGAEGAHVDYHDPLVPELQIGDEPLCSVDPDPRRDASGFGPEDYALAIVVTVHPGHDYGWLKRVPEVLDCTYHAEAGRRRFVP